MQLTAENYYSEEANFEYMSVSQFKDFIGTYGRRGCEFSAMDKLRGVYKEKETTALLVGSYVDSYFEGTLDKFKAEHPDIFKKTGDKGLKSEYLRANDIIARIERDEFFMAHMSGQKQVIMTGELFGLPWKIKIDSYLENIAIVDLKVMASLSKLEWVRDIGYLDFVRYWGYDIQGAVYQEIVYQNTGKRLPFYIAGASKEEATNIKVIHVQDNYLREAMSVVEHNIERVKDTYTIRVPDTADTSGKAYAEPMEYSGMDDEKFLGYWTIQRGDIIVRGLSELEEATETELKQSYLDVITVTNFTDNRSRCSACMMHWRIGGE